MFETLQTKLHDRARRCMGVSGLSVRAVLLCFAVLITFNACPDLPWRPVVFGQSADDDLAAYARKLREPFADLAKSPADTSHASKLNYRLAVPVLCGSLGLDLKGLRWVGIGLALGCIALLLSLFERLTGDRVAALWWTLFFCALPVSGRLFFDLHPFDRFAIFFGVAAIALRNPVLVGACVFAGAWTDERCLLASVWVLALHGALWYRQRSASAFRCVVAVVAAWLCYAVTRWLVWKTTGMTVAHGGVHAGLFAVHVGNLPSGVFMALETGWFALAAMLLWMILQRQCRWLGLMLTGLMLVCTLACVLVIDLTRSLNHFWIALPAMIAVVTACRPDEWAPPKLRTLGLALAVSCLMLPSTESYLVGYPGSQDGTGGRLVLLGMFKPLPLRVVAWLLGIPQG